MSEPRNFHLVTYIEETFFMEANAFAAKEGESLSSYIRMLVIKDLIERGIITKNIFFRVTVG